MNKIFCWIQFLCQLVLHLSVHWVEWGRFCVYCSVRCTCLHASGEYMTFINIVTGIIN